MSIARDPVQATLDAGIVDLGLELDSAARQRLLDYLDLLMRWNRSFNLTGTRSPAGIVTRHLLDSLSVTPYLRGDRVLDAGTGAGLPGMVLAVARPEIGFTLLDSAGKKTRFCIQAAADLGLDNVRVVRTRIEAFSPPARFSCLVTRAFQQAPELSTLAPRLMEPGGLMLIMKGLYPVEELLALKAAGYAARATPLSVPGLNAARHLLQVDIP